MGYQAIRDCILFYAPEAAGLAIKIAAHRPNITVGAIRWEHFPDGFPNFFVVDADSLRDKRVVFLASFHSPAAIFNELCVIQALPRYFLDSFTLVLPFFPTGTMERVDTEGDIATAHSLARLLDTVPHSRGGPTPLIMFDIHALQVPFYFGPSILPACMSGIPLLLDALSCLPDHDKVTIAFPDDGAEKRFSRCFPTYPHLVCSKVRDGDLRLIKVKQGVALGRHLVIVDDLVQSGGTLIECHGILAAQGAMHGEWPEDQQQLPPVIFCPLSSLVTVSCYITHGVFPNKSYLKFNPEVAGDARTGFSHFWLTDSCPAAGELVGQDPFVVMSLAPIIADALA